MFCDDTEREAVKRLVSTCKHFTWLDNAPNVGVCTPHDNDVRKACYLVCPDIDEDLENCLECGGFDE